MTVQNEESREFSFSKWLAEGLEAAMPRRWESRLVPAEARKHLRAAKREMLLAARSLLDKAIDHLEQEPAAPKKTTKIKVE